MKIFKRSGTLLLSGSDDHRLVITDPFNYRCSLSNIINQSKILSRVREDVRTAHRANIFSAQFLPETSDHQIVSCAGDGAILHTDILRQEIIKTTYLLINLLTQARENPQLVLQLPRRHGLRGGNRAWGSKLLSDLWRRWNCALV